MMKDRLSFYSDESHKCDTCRYSAKCRRFIELYQKLYKIGIDYFDKYLIDVDIDFAVTRCERYEEDYSALNGVTVDFDDENEGEQEDGE